MQQHQPVGPRGADRRDLRCEVGFLGPDRLLGDDLDAEVLEDLLRDLVVVDRVLVIERVGERHALQAVARLALPEHHRQRALGRRLVAEDAAGIVLLRPGAGRAGGEHRDAALLVLLVDRDHALGRADAVDDRNVLVLAQAAELGDPLRSVRETHVDLVKLERAPLDAAIAVDHLDGRQDPFVPYPLAELDQRSAEHIRERQPHGFAFGLREHRHGYRERGDKAQRLEVRCGPACHGRPPRLVNVFTFPPLSTRRAKGYGVWQG